MKCICRKSACRLASGLLTLSMSASPRHFAGWGGCGEGSTIMLNWALTFLIVALIAAIFGFTGIAANAAWIAQVLFVVFLVLFLVSALTGAVRRPPVA